MLTLRIRSSGHQVFSLFLIVSLIHISLLLELGSHASLHDANDEINPVVS